MLIFALSNHFTELKTVKVAMMQCGKTVFALLPSVSIRKFSVYWHLYNIVLLFIKSYTCFDSTYCTFRPK